MVELKKRLKQKGWPEDIAKKTEEILSSPEKKEKHVMFGKTMSGYMFWLGLIVLTLCMLGIAFFLIPFFIVVTNYFLHFVIMALAIVFGLLFDFIIKDIEHLDTKHHVFAALYIPIMAISFLAISVAISNRVDELLGVTLHRTPWGISIVFVITFMVPYLISLIKKKRNK
ncbi:hypothetical protein KY330_01085 [Candidatus Woesearchaeota archaeon]|nr:hypothetical protein [Candidatus Woesearchaeota archaeon]